MSKSKTLSSGTSPGEQLGGTSSCSVSTHPCSSHCWPATNKAPGVASSCLCPWGVLWADSLSALPHFRKPPGILQVSPPLGSFSWVLEAELVSPSTGRCPSLPQGRAHIQDCLLPHLPLTLQGAPQRWAVSLVHFCTLVLKLWAWNTLMKWSWNDRKRERTGRGTARGRGRGERVKTRWKRSPRTRGMEGREVMEKQCAIGVWSGEGKGEEAREEGNHRGEAERKVKRINGKRKWIKKQGRYLKGDGGKCVPENLWEFLSNQHLAPGACCPFLHPHKAPGLVPHWA